MSDKIGIGVVGLGYWGPNLVRNFRSLRDCRLKAMCDLSEDSPQAPSIPLPGSRSGQGLRPSPERRLHRRHRGRHRRPLPPPLAKAALEAGKHVFVEKPMASSTAECQELIDIAAAKNLTLMVGHTFLYSPPVRMIKEIIDRGDIGDIRYISARRLNLGLYQKDINVTWDLAPHDISIILHIMEETPVTINCQGAFHVTPGIEDVTTLSLSFRKERSAIVQSSWLDPRKVREMTIVGSKRMIVYDDVATNEKIKIFDARVERPPHYDTFAEFQYAYHYGDIYIPHIQQAEPLKTECQHFLDCIKSGEKSLTSGEKGLEVVRILEASTESLKLNGGPVEFNNGWQDPAASGR